MEKRDRLYDDLVDYNINFDKLQGYVMWNKIEKLGESVIVLQDKNMAVQMDVNEPLHLMEIKITGTICPAEMSEYDGYLDWFQRFVDNFNRKEIFKGE